MAKGIEGGRLRQRGTEGELIYQEEQNRNPAQVIEKIRSAGIEAVAQSRLVAVLNGDEATPYIANATDPQKKLSLANTFLQQNDFLRKLLPSHFDTLEQAAFVATIAEEITRQKSASN